MNGEYAKCCCAACGSHIEFPIAGAGTTINCPHCSHPTELTLPSFEETAAAGSVSLDDVMSAFRGSISRTPVSFFYQMGLLLATVVMVLLPVVYVALIIAAGWGVYAYGSHFSFLLSSFRGGGRVYLVKLLIYLGPLLAGGVMVLFMLKPLFARQVKTAEPLALNPAVEKTLFAFIMRICQLVGAPMPSRIDLDCQLNASAGFRRGFLSFFGNDLVLTIGLPLVAGLSARDLAGVVAHEFGHFTQGLGMRLSYVIRRVNGWFARVIFERDAWDVMLDQIANETEDAWMSILIACARFGVWCSRQVLLGLMLFGHVVCCFLLRQMEYDADSYQIKLIGSAGCEAMLVRLNLLGEALARAHKDMRATWKAGKELPNDFPAYLLQHEADLPPALRQKIEDTVGFDKTGLFSTHPCDADRIRKARQMGELGVFNLDIPARELFANFNVISTQVTMLHYAEDLGIPLQMTKLVPVKPSKATMAPGTISGETEQTTAKPVPRFKVPQR